ncbi:hypothetical protein ERJ75_000632300 [Trypanosoma vivax]|nr:hypothetical protein ERJ75_000632300 [Trypanosoma vivax]
MMGFALALAALVQLSVDRAMVAEGASSKGLTQADAKKVCGLGAALQDGVRIAKQVAEGAQEKAAHLVAAATAIGHALEALRVEEMGTRAQGPAENLLANCSRQRRQLATHCSMRQWQRRCAAPSSLAPQAQSCSSEDASLVAFKRRTQRPAHQGAASLSKTRREVTIDASSRASAKARELDR